VTLIVGIICKDGIVVASESQTTGEFGEKRCDANKIYCIELADRSRGLVATAGRVDSSSLAVEIIERLAKDSRLEHSRSFADLAEKANGEIKQKERSQGRRSSLALKKHFEDHRYVLMIANYFKGNPCLFTLTSDGLISPPRVSKQSFKSVGNSYATADYILNKFDFSAMDRVEAALAAIYVVNEVIGVDSTCGYPIRAGTVYHYPSLRCKSGVSFLPPDWIAWAVEEFKEQNARLSKAWKQRLTDIIFGVATRRKKSGQPSPLAPLPIEENPESE